MTKNSSRRRRSNSNNSTALQQVLDNFVACGRCSFFLAGYRVLHGVQALEQAAENKSDSWLPLMWDHETRHLVHKSYGNRIDVELYYLDGRCPECQRRFTYEEEPEEEQQTQLQLELK